MNDTLEKEMSHIEKLIDALITKNGSLKEKLLKSADELLQEKKQSAKTSENSNQKAEIQALQKKLDACQKHEQRIKEMLYVLRQNIEACLEEAPQKPETKETLQADTTPPQPSADTETSKATPGKPSRKFEYTHEAKDSLEAMPIKAMPIAPAAPAETAPTAPAETAQKTQGNTASQVNNKASETHSSWLHDASHGDESDPFAETSKPMAKQEHANNNNNSNSNSNKNKMLSDEEFFSAIS